MYKLYFFRFVCRNTVWCKDRKTMENKNKVMLLSRMWEQSRSRRRKRNKQLIILMLVQAEQNMKLAALLTEMITTSRINTVQRPRRLIRNPGWFDTLWHIYSPTRYNCKSLLMYKNGN